MGRYSPAARRWIILVAIVATVVTAERMFPLVIPHTAFIGFGLLAACAAIAHLFPIRSVIDGSSLRLTNVFVFAGAVILPPSLLTLLGAVSITLDTFLKRRSPGAWVRWTFNVAQISLAAHAARAWILMTGIQSVGSFQGLGTLFVAAAIYFTVQELLVGTIIALNSRIPLHRTGVFTLPSIQGNGMQGVLGVLVAGLWLTNPLLLVLVFPLLAMAHLLTREAHMAKLAQVDAKTGLHNYRHFEYTANDEITRSLRVGRPLSLLFADIDYLRQVNNQYGHLAGDRVLLEVANLMRDALRQGDLVARFGGEEFIALLPGTDGEEAVVLAERVREAVANHRFILNDGTELRCTISVGVATCPDDASDLAGLLRQSDMAMYRAKQTRNAVARGMHLPPVPRLPTEHDPLHPPTAERKANGTVPEPRPWGVKAVVWTSVAGGLVSLGWGLVNTFRSPAWVTLGILVCLMMIAELVPVRVFHIDPNRGEKISFTFSTAVLMAAVPLVPSSVPLISLAGSTVFILRSRRQKVDQILFNLSNPVLAVGMAGWLYLRMAPAPGTLTVTDVLAPVLAACGQALLNFGGLSLILTFVSGKRLADVLRESSTFGLSHFFMGLSGALLGSAHVHWGWIGDTLFLLPLSVLWYSLFVYAGKSEQSIAVLQTAKEQVESAHLEKEETLRRLIETVASIIDARDNATFGHSRQVAKYAVALGKECALSPAELAVLHTAGLLHDLGKVGIPEALLHKPSRLTPDEYEIVKEHAGLGEQILSEVPQLGQIARMIGEHHERFDGKGYPRGRRAGEITLGGRILAVADALDSILTDRPYSRGRPLDWALAEMDQCAGTQFDPHVVAALHRVVAKEGSGFFVTGEAEYQRTHPIVAAL